MMRIDYGKDIRQAGSLVIRKDVIKHKGILSREVYILLTVKKGSKSFYVGDSESAPLAEMIFSADKDIITIEHTFVSDELRGQGAGRQLLQTLAAWVREDNKKIIAVCPFAKKELTKSQEYDDVLYQLPR